jgi:hypothetical protein
MSDIVSKYTGIVPDKIIQKAIDDVNSNGYMTIEQINKYIKNNTHKSEFEFDENQVSATEFIYIDMRINYNLFVVGNTFHTYETLNELHPFEQFGKKPEDILTRQVAVVTESKYRTMTSVQDIDMESNEFYKVLKSTPTQIYIAGKVWKEFADIINFSNGFRQFVTPLLLAGGPSSIGFLTDILGIPKKFVNRTAQIEDARLAQIEEKIENKLKPLIAENEEKDKKIKELEARLAELL